MGVQGYELESPVPESYAGPKTWWADTATVDDAVFLAEGERLTGEDMMRAAGLDWQVRTEPEFFYRRVGQTADGYITEAAEVPNRRAIVRDSDEKVLGSATKVYHPIQNSVLFEVGDTVLDLTEAHWETAGSLYGGKLVWALARIDKDLYIKGDESPIRDFIHLFQGHDGVHPLVVGESMVRVVCGNTQRMSMDGMTGQFRILHTANADRRIAEVKAALDIRSKYIETFVAKMNDLTERPMTIEDVKRFTVELLPTNPDVERPFKTLAMRESIESLFANSVTLADVPLTAYRAFQSVTEFADQYRSYGKNGQAADKRALAIIEGSAYNMKSRALALLAKA